MSGTQESEPMKGWGERISGMLQGKPWRKFKKTDWAVLALAGVLLMILAMPTGGREPKKELAPVAETREEGGREETKNGQEDDYISLLEKRLEEVLSQMEGVGKAAVMITAADNGTNVVEKDIVETSVATTENDSGGGSRAIKEQRKEGATIYVENGQEKTPYVQKETLPAIEGIVVVAEGGGDIKIVSDISETIQALFPIEAHRIKVVKMSSKEG